jgi:hypothetical protein
VPNLALIALGDSHHSQGGMKFATQISPLLNLKYWSPVQNGMYLCWHTQHLSDLTFLQKFHKRLHFSVKKTTNLAKLNHPAGSFNRI